MDEGLGHELEEELTLPEAPEGDGRALDVGRFLQH